MFLLLQAVASFPADLVEAHLFAQRRRPDRERGYQSVSDWTASYRCFAGHVPRRIDTLAASALPRGLLMTRLSLASRRLSRWKTARSNERESTATLPEVSISPEAPSSAKRAVARRMTVHLDQTSGADRLVLKSRRSIMSRFFVAAFVGLAIAAAVSTSASAYHCLARAPNGASGHGLRRLPLKGPVNFNAPVHTPRRWGWLPNRMVPAVLGQDLLHNGPCLYFGLESHSGMGGAGRWQAREDVAIFGATQAGRAGETPPPPCCR